MSENILDKASKIVKERGAVYGTPREDYTRTAKMWSAIIGVEITPEKAILCMIALKISRLCQTPGHADSTLDMAGYSWCYDDCFTTGEKDENQREFNFDRATDGPAQAEKVTHIYQHSGGGGIYIGPAKPAEGNETFRERCFYCQHGGGRCSCGKHNGGKPDA